MINTLVIYGASDDLIEIESEHEELFKSEEFNVCSDLAGLTVAISDGTLLRVRYDEDGIWRFTPVVLGSCFMRIDPGVDDRRHSDRVVLSGSNLLWVVLGSQMTKAKFSN